MNQKQLNIIKQYTTEFEYETLQISVNAFDNIESYDYRRISFIAEIPCTREEYNNTDFNSIAEEIDERVTNYLKKHNLPSDLTCDKADWIEHKLSNNTAYLELYLDLEDYVSIDVFVQNNLSAVKQEEFDQKWEEDFSDFREEALLVHTTDVLEQLCNKYLHTTF